MKLLYGWSEEGKFVLMVTEDDERTILHRVSMTAEEAKMIASEINYSKKNRTISISDHEQLR